MLHYKAFSFVNAKSPFSGMNPSPTTSFKQYINTINDHGFQNVMKGYC